MAQLILIYITAPNYEKAQEIMQHLLAQRLIACATIFPAKSLYMWQGNMCNDNEVIIIAKTFDEHYKKIEDEIIALHPYKVPCIIKIEAQANVAYQKWVEYEIKQK